MRLILALMAAWVVAAAGCAQSGSVRAPQRVTAIVDGLSPPTIGYNAPLVFLAGYFSAIHR